MNELDIELLPHPPYSPDLGICDFWLFQNLKKKAAWSEILVPRGVEVRCEQTFTGDVRSWVERWDKCKLCKGRYFEKE